MGILRKAAIGSLIVGLGALAVTQNKKQVEKLKKSFVKTAKNVLKSGAVKKTARLAAHKSSKTRKRSS